MEKKKYEVTVYFISKTGNPYVKRYEISAASQDVAIDIAGRKVEKLKFWSKTTGGTATILPDIK